VYYTTSAAKVSILKCKAKGKTTKGFGDSDDLTNAEESKLHRGKTTEN
jgi:hypothetical protein